MRSLAKSYWICVVLLGAWLAAWIVITWPSMMDDALIHLRFADHLWRQHMVSYDGVSRSYGASSLLYVALLAVLRGLVSASPVLPRAVSSAALMILFAALAAGLARRLRNAAPLAWILSLLVLAILVMPSSVRWLDDGMETPIVLILTMLLVFAAWDFCTGSRKFLVRAEVALPVLGFFIVMLRVEMLLLLGIVSATMLAARRERSDGNGLRISPRLLLECASPVVGGLLAAGLIVLLMHSLLPDTALAKSFGAQAWRGTLMMTGKVFAGSMSFGLGSLLVWLLSWIAAAMARKNFRLSSLIANSPFPIVILLTVVRGQAVQGVRYFEWALLYSILWNILELAAAREAMTMHARRALVAAACGLGALLLISAPVEAHMLKQLFHAREDTLAEFRAQNLDHINGLRVVAFDVGSFGYFSGAPLCDMAGLVNGREAAMMTYTQRVARCAAWQPQAGFLNRDQMKDLNAQYNLKDWSICGEYGYSNLRELDPHYLIAAPENAKDVCAAAHGTPRAISTVLH